MLTEAEEEMKEMQIANRARQLAAQQTKQAKSRADMDGRKAKTRGRGKK